MKLGGTRRNDDADGINISIFLKMRDVEITFLSKLGKWHPGEIYINNVLR